MANLSKPQIKKIYATARQIGWDNEMLHFFLRSQIGKEHISDLTRHEAMIFIDELMGILGVPPNGYRADKKADAKLRAEGLIIHCTPAQCDKIRYLMNEADWTEGRLKGYLEQYGAKKLEDLTRTLANNLTEYLKAEIKRLALSHSNRENEDADVSDPW